MSFIRRIKRGKRIYLAEVENKREGVKVRQKIIRYLGRDLQGSTTDESKKIFFDSSRVSGSVLALNWIADKIGLSLLLGEYAKPILTLVYAHCHHYQSASKASDWYQKTDLRKVFGDEEMPENSIRTAIYELGKMDLITLQKSIFENIIAFTGEKTESVIYDVTNTYFFGNNCKLAKMGLDKEGIRGRKLIQIGLAITKKYGFPIFHQLHPGNTSEHKLFLEAIIHLRRFKIYKGFIVYDRGMTSKISIFDLFSHEWKVIAGMPMHKGIKKIISKMNFSSIKNIRYLIIQGETKFYVKTKKYIFGDVKGRLIILLNRERKAKIEDNRLTHVLNLQEKIIKKGLIKDDEKKWFNKNGKINSHALKRAEKFDGLSCIFTNTNLSLPDIVHTYFDRGLIERSFQTFKSILSLRPVRFWLEDNVAVHTLICHLSYALITTFRFLLDQKRGKPGYLDLDGISAEEALDELTYVYRIYFHTTKIKNDEEGIQSKLITLSKRQDAIMRAISSTLTL